MNNELAYDVLGKEFKFCYFGISNINLVNLCKLQIISIGGLGMITWIWMFLRILWDLLLSIGGISWVFPSSVLYTLLAWQGVAVGKKRKKIWTAAPMCLF